MIRVFPPCTPTTEKGCVFYKLLRPEFVAKYKVPLSSDAFTKFGQADKDVHNTEVQEATNYLLNVSVPQVNKISLQ